MNCRSISNIRMIEPINPSLWRSANRNTARNVRAVYLRPKGHAGRAGSAMLRQLVQARPPCMEER